MSHRPWNYGITRFWIGITSHVTWREAMVGMVQYRAWERNCFIFRNLSIYIILRLDTMPSFCAAAG